MLQHVWLWLLKLVLKKFRCVLPIQILGRELCVNRLMIVTLPSLNVFGGTHSIVIDTRDDFVETGKLIKFEKKCTLSKLVV